MPNIVVPELGESVVEARVAKWLKQVGDRVSAGEPLVELETEKIDLEVSADRAGVLASIAHQEGADVKVGEVLGVLEEAAAAAPTDREELRRDRPADAIAPSVSSAASAALPSVSSAASAAPSSVPSAAAASEEIRVTPTARNVAKAHDVKLQSVPATGPRVTKGDVLRAATSSADAPSPASARPGTPAEARPSTPVEPARGARTETRERMSKRRATIARRLVEAQHTAAMLTTFNEVDMSAVMELCASGARTPSTSSTASASASHPSSSRPPSARSRPSPPSTPRSRATRSSTSTTTTSAWRWAPKAGWSCP
jgi:2-oxoglutarate dehydrogenase E2 component (dihydrolipoamide succinyltransferase)